VTILEKMPHRAEFARSYCADYAFVNPPKEADEGALAYSRRVAKKILSEVPKLDRGFDICIEASGAEECMQMGLILCRPGGCCKSLCLMLRKKTLADHADL
jgi:D-xylulose reductase